MSHLRHRARILLFGAFALCGYLAAQESPDAQSKEAAPARCAAVTLHVALKAGEEFSRRVNAESLTLFIRADREKARGWSFSLEDAQGDDYIYPVNPPLRFNPSQTLGQGYGESAKESLEGVRDMEFLLNRADYDQLEPLLTNALWPYTAPNPEKAADEYLSALDKVRTGRLRLKALSADIAADDSVRGAEFQIELIAPPEFRFDPALKPRAAACPSDSD